MVSFALAMVAALCATEAGRVSESGTGAMWIAPEIVAAMGVPMQTCGHSAARAASMIGRELIFETIDPADFDAAENARLLAEASREVVHFEWNPTTGELSYDTSAPTAIFSDLAVSTRISRHPAPSCESR